MTAAADAALALAAREADALGSPAIECEHLFIALCKSDTLREWAVGSQDAEAARQLQLEASTFMAALGRAPFDMVRARRKIRSLWLAAHPERAPFSGHRSAECRAVFSAAAQTPGVATATLAALFLALLRANNPLIAKTLTEQSIELPRITEEVGRLIQEHVHPLSKWGRDLTALARAGKLHAAVGREAEVKHVARILLQAGRGSPLLIGDPGVGKTAIVEALALRISAEGVPPALRKLRIIEISPGALVAGTSRRGDLESRVQLLLKIAEEDPTLVLFFDEIHLLVTSSGGLDVASLLKPALASGALRCIGATTVAEYRRHVERDAALARRLQAVFIDEPSRETALAILRGRAESIAAHHGVTIEDSALHASIDLAIRYLADRRLPDKAIDLLDHACSRALLSTFSPLPHSAAADHRRVDATVVAAVIAERCRVPLERLTADETRRLLDMEETLRARVIGQDEAIAAIASAVRTAKVALRNPQRPVGVFLLTGPTGTGKTELAKALAEFLFGDERSLLRFDMSEYTEKHQVARLIGSPPGYIGYYEGGQLTEAIRARPYSVVLLDEFEKAHPSVHTVFLQVFDEGMLTDGQGRKASFRDAVILLTANLGGAADVQEDAAIGFLPAKANTPYVDVRGMIAASFPPEVTNRIDKVIAFKQLSRAAIRAIVGKIVRGANAALTARGMSIELSDAASDFVADAGYSADYGARALERTFRALVEEPIGRMILDGRVRSGERVAVGVSNGALTFDTSASGSKLNGT